MILMKAVRVACWTCDASTRVRGTGEAHWYPECCIRCHYFVRRRIFDITHISRGLWLIELYWGDYLCTPRAQPK